MRSTILTRTWKVLILFFLILCFFAIDRASQSLQLIAYEAKYEATRINSKLWDMNAELKAINTGLGDINRELTSQLINVNNQLTSIESDVASIKGDLTSIKLKLP